MNISEHLQRAINILAAKPVGVKLATQAIDNYDFDADFILDAKNKYTGQVVGRFAYNPKTRELAIGDMTTMHAITIGNQFRKSKFDDFVRGVYTGDKVMLRWYGDPMLSRDEIKSASFEAWYDTKEMLEKNGLPPGMPVEMGVTTETLKEELGTFYK